MMDDLDWLLHVVICVGTLAVAYSLGKDPALVWVAILNVVGWPLREYMQHQHDGRFFSAHVMREWAAPSGIAWAVLSVVAMENMRDLNAA